MFVLLVLNRCYSTYSVNSFVFSFILIFVHIFFSTKLNVEDNKRNKKTWLFSITCSLDNNNDKDNFIDKQA